MLTGKARKRDRAPAPDAPPVGGLRTADCRETETGQGPQARPRAGA